MKQSFTRKAVFALTVLVLSILVTELPLGLLDGSTHVAEAAKIDYQTTTNLNMRSGASTKHKILLTIPKGKKVAYVSKSGSWFKVKYSGKTGFVSSTYIKKGTTAAQVKAKSTAAKVSTPSKVQYQTTTSLNMRSGASTKHKILLTIPKGKNVEYISKSGSWFKVEYNNKTGFVSSSYIKKVNTSAAAKTQVKPTYISGVLVVNKKHGLPSTYAPGENKNARSAFNKMASAASKDGVKLTVFSTYRSFDYQKNLYNAYVKKDGQKAADRYSAKPGHSEHQTGLAFDIAQTGAKNIYAESNATRWMAKNAHKYGFIVRYPKGKEHITGYMYEPWHLRYLGTELATKVYNSGKTLEEYLGI